MKYLYSWLNQYHNTGKSPEELAEIITSLGTEIEKIHTAKIDDNVIVAEILEVKPHPNADRLQVARISTGKEELEVVCGAPNIEAGQLVPFAQIGAKLGDIEVKEAEIRGVKSPGMLCSEVELGIGEDHSGIKILKDVEVGEKVSKYLSNDAVLEAEVTPNRGDLLSHFGLIRDVAAFQGKKLERPTLELKESGEDGKNSLSVEIKSDKCSLYLARMISNVKIGPSPAWLQEKLIACGAKPINNVVDVTNFVMLDLGQPLHAFDGKKIEGNKIIVREIEKEEEVETLDGARRALLPEMLVIADQNRPVAIAGVMGLKNSEVDEQTTDIILEAAVFSRPSIRKTSKLLSLQTEASYRFEREVDDGMTEYALNKAAQMIAELSGGEIQKGIIKAGEVEKEKTIKIFYEKINSLSGNEFSKEEIEKVLADLGFEIKGDEVSVPSWRHDIHSWEDLTEEVIRILGLNRIKPAPLQAQKISAQDDYHKKEKIKDFLVQIGLTEVLNYSFLSEEDVKAAKIEPKDLVEVSNPVQDENKYLRNSLIPGLLKDVAKNPSFDDVEIFEIGNVFSKDLEQTNLAIATSGKGARKIKEILKKLNDEFGVSDDQFKVYDIDREELKRFKIKKPSVSVAEVSLGGILPKMIFKNLDLEVEESEILYREVSKFPPVKRDLAFVVDEKVTLSGIKKEILKASQNVVLVEPFDEFADKRFGQGKKNVAFHVWLQDLQKTMSDKAADEEISEIINDLKESFDADLRS